MEIFFILNHVSQHEVYIDYVETLKNEEIKVISVFFYFLWQMANTVHLKLLFLTKGILLFISIYSPFSPVTFEYM